MYFMQEAGEPLRLTYQKAPYGPYAEKPCAMCSIILKGTLLVAMGDAGDSPDKSLELKPHASAQAEAFLAQHEGDSATVLTKWQISLKDLRPLSAWNCCPRCIGWRPTNTPKTAEEAVVKDP
jgi:hypothetical protein